MIGTQNYNKNKEDFLRKLDIEPNNKLISQTFTEEYENQLQDEKTDMSDIDENISQLDETENHLHYHYLEDNLLHQNFSLCTKENDKYTIHFCLYAVQMEFNPFLKFVMVQKQINLQNYYSFPSIEFTCSMHDNIDVIFKNECVKHVINVLNLDHITPDQIDYMYEGFIEENEDIFVVFDISRLNYVLESNYLYAIIDEIINCKKIMNIPVEKKITDFFFENNYMIHLSNTNDEEIQYPIVVYNVIDANGKLKNVYHQESESQYDEINITTHPLFGEKYYFTSVSIDNYYENIVRYGFFSHNSQYILPDIIKLDEKDIAMQGKTIYFHENGRQYWCVEDIHKIFIIK